MAEQKECRMALSNIKWLWLQTSSTDAGNDLLAGTTWRRPERHAAPRWDCTPFSHWNVLTTFYAKLQFTKSHTYVCFKSDQEQQWCTCSDSKLTNNPLIHFTMLWRVTNPGLVDKDIIWSECNNLCQAAASQCYLYSNLYKHTTQQWV